MPAEVAGQIEIEDETDDDEDPLVNPPANKTNCPRPALKWKKMNQCYNMPSTAGAEERRRKVIEFPQIANMADPIKLEIPPLRSLDDFIMESARFQIPTFSDVEKWNNRVIQNLLYYQTNYFLTYIVIVILVSVIHPAQMFFGMIAMALGFGMFFYITNNKQFASDFKKSHPVVSVTLVLTGSYLVVYLLGSVVVFIFGILLPIIVIFIHASMRLRNLKNKLINKVEWLGLRRSPMGVFLDFLGMEQEFLMEKISSFIESNESLRKMFAEAK